MTNSQKNSPSDTERVFVRMGDGEVRAYNLAPSSASNVRAAGKVLSSLSSKRATGRSALSGRFATKSVTRRNPASSFVQRSKKTGK